MAQSEPSAAQALFGHLPSASRPEVQQRKPTVSDAMWPSLSRAAKAAEAHQQRWQEWCKRQRDILLKNLREANGRGGRMR